MEMITEPSINWVINGLDIIGLDQMGAVVIHVKTGGSTWRYSFPGMEGRGEIKIGHGFDYNPLQIIEMMFFNVQDGFEVEVEIDLESTFDALSEDWA